MSSLKGKSRNDQRWQSPGAVRVFCSYSHRDKKRLEQLQTQLAQMKRERLISAWCDQRIPVGESFDPAIRAELRKADLFLMLLSPEFLASRYCQGIEVKWALKRHAQRDMMIIPVVVVPCDWKTTPFAHLKVAPDDGKPICEWRPRAKGWNNVVDLLRFALTPERLRVG